MSSQVLLIEDSFLGSANKSIYGGVGHGFKVSHREELKNNLMKEKLI